MFSIIIPLYNKAAHIEKAIKSVLNQSYHEFELIIVNDGSSDNSVSIVERYLETQKQNGNDSLTNHVTIIHQSNSGVSAARNNGVKIAKYNYIAFLDADDWWNKHYLSNMKELIEAFPDAHLYGSSYYLVKQQQFRNAKIKFDTALSSGYIDYFKLYLRTLNMPICTSGIMMLKSTFEEFDGFNPALRLGEDFDLWVRVALKYKVAFVNQPLVYFNQDVEPENKAVVNDKIYDPQSHFIFNLHYLAHDEANNIHLKKLLDALRLYNLERYRLQNAYPELVRREIQKINFKDHPFKYWLFYHLPVTPYRILYSIRKYIIRKKASL